MNESRQSHFPLRWSWPPHSLATALALLLAFFICCATASGRVDGSDGLRAASDLRVLSLRLTSQSRDAVNGSAESYQALRTTKAAIDANLRLLNARFGTAPGMAQPIRAVNNTWKPLAQRTDDVLRSQQAVLALIGHADRFSGKTSQLQAQLNEVVRGLASGGAGSGQMFTALQQVVTLAAMTRRIAELRAGGSGAQVAADALGRDSAVFDRSMNALRNGGGDIGRVTSVGAVAPLNQAHALWQVMKRDIDAIVGDSRTLVGAQASAKALDNGAERLSSDSNNLFAAFLAFPPSDSRREPIRQW